MGCQQVAVPCSMSTYTEFVRTATAQKGTAFLQHPMLPRVPCVLKKLPCRAPVRNAGEGLVTASHLAKWGHRPTQTPNMSQQKINTFRKSHSHAPLPTTRNSFVVSGSCCAALSSRWDAPSSTLYFTGRVPCKCRSAPPITLARWAWKRTPSHLRALTTRPPRQGVWTPPPHRGTRQKIFPRFCLAGSSAEQNPGPN